MERETKISGRKISKKSAEAILQWFRANMSGAKSELDYNSPFQLLCAVLLSAQCTDKRVNMVTPALFAAYPTPEKMAKATPQELFEIIKSISFPNNKARNLAAMAKRLVEQHNGIVPPTVEEIEQLPGCGHKTANVVASIIYGAQVIAVDTHVFRVSRRIGFSNSSTPLGVEKDLNGYIKLQERGEAHHWLILHGRYVCVARAPKCAECGIAQWCLKRGVKEK